MRRIVRYSISMFGAGMLLATTFHSARATYVCAVQPTPEGFAALRAKPEVAADVITQAQPGDAVVIQQKDNGDWIEDGKWVSVFHYPGEVLPEVSDPEYANGKIGWMLRSAVSDCG